jgi:pimeloyl-ACP methyl ester carboxylesterase
MRAGWATISPDFLGYGASSPTPEPEQMHQLYSVVNAVELYMSVQKPVYEYANSAVKQKAAHKLPGHFDKIVLWGHSNGGQVAIHFLEVTRLSIPTVLWAPVGVPFPDDIAYYSRYFPGSGDMRWAKDFANTHKPGDYSLLSHLGSIAPGCPILMQQGTNDHSVEKSWNDTLAAAINSENEKRKAPDRINFTYIIYPDANHNLEPYWNTRYQGKTVYQSNIEFWGMR